MNTPAETIGIAVVCHGDNHRCLVGVREAPGPLQGKLEFPGGRCREGETPVEAAVRECREETGLEVEPVRLLDERTHAYEHVTLALHFWLCRVVAEETGAQKSGSLPLAPFAWRAIEELSAEQFPAANAAVVALLTVGPPAADESPVADDQTASTQDS